MPEADAPPAGDAPRARPIFVLGLQRSGTTWLANLLAAHPDVAAVQSEDHFGIHESIFFSHFARAYGDLADDQCFGRFVEDFSTSDYYLLTGIERAWLLERRDRTYAAIFRDLMDELAARQSRRFWVEKSPHHTLLADRLAADFPDARFVCITRRPADMIRSRMWSSGRSMPGYPRRWTLLLRGTWTAVLYQRWLERFDAACPRSMMTRYERLRADPEAEARRMCEFLGLDYTPGMLERRYAPNSSFQSKIDRRRKSLNAGDRALVGAAALGLRAAPFGFLHGLAERRRRQRGIDWPDWCWRRRDAALTATEGELPDPA